MAEIEAVAAGRFWSALSPRTRKQICPDVRNNPRRDRCAAPCRGQAGGRQAGGNYFRDRRPAHSL